MFNTLGNSTPRNNIRAEYLLNGDTNDTSGNGYNGTPTNVIWGGDGNILYQKGYASFNNGFNARTSYITTNTGFIQDDLVISFWARTDQSTSQWYMLPFCYESSGQVHTRIEFGNSSGTPNNVAMKIGATSQTSAVTGAILKRDNTWQYWVFKRSKSGSTYTATIYLDGVQVATSSANSTNVTPSGVTPTIGASSIAGGGFNGEIAGLRIDGSLTDDEMMLRFLEGRRLLGPTNIAKYPSLLSGLVGYFRAEDTGGTALYNLVNGITATRVGGTNTTDNLGINKAISNPNYTWASLTYTTGYTFENSGSGWSLVTSPSGLSATGINRTTTLRDVFLFSRTLSTDERNLLESLCNSEYPYPTPSYDIASLRDGLKLNYDLSYNGTTYYDTSGNGYNLTGTNITNTRQGKIKTVGLLTANNGSNIVANVSHGVTPTTPITINKWAKTGYSGTYGFLLYFDIPAPYNLSYVFTAHNGTYQIDAVRNGTAEQRLDSGVAVDGNKWRMITGTFNNGSYKIYIDGIERASGSYSTSAGSFNTTSAIRGYLNYGSGHTNYQGQTRILNRILTAKEIQQLYYSQKGNYIY